jgi:hypothetical protein
MPPSRIDCEIMGFYGQDKRPDSQDSAAQRAPVDRCHVASGVSKVTTQSSRNLRKYFSD